MKKTLITITAVVLLVLVAVPGIIGIFAEKEFRKLSDNVGTASPGIRWQVDEYERGWFSSTARYRLVFDYPWLREAMDEHAGTVEAMPTLINDAVIYHGLIPLAGMGAGVSPLPALAHSVDSPALLLPDGKTLEFPGSISTRLRLTGKHVNRIRIGHFEDTLSGSEGSGADLSWAGMDLVTRFNTQLDAFELEGHIGALTVASPEGQLESGRADVDTRMRLTEFGIWVGDGTASWDGLKVDAPEQPGMISLGRIVSDATLAVDEGRLREDFVITAENIRVGDWQGGPAMISVELADLDARAMGELSRMAQASLKTPGDPAGGPDFNNFMPQIQALLAAGPDIRLREISLGTPDGKVMLTAQLAFPETEPEAAFGFILGLNGTARLRLPVALVDQVGALDPEAAKRISDLTETGMLIRDDGFFILDAALKGGLLTLNGQPVPLPLVF